MQTPILLAITKYCSIYVDDIRLSELTVSDPPLFARNMWQYLLPALTLFDRPSEMQKYIFGTTENPNLIEPVYDSTTITTTEEYTESFTFNLGEQYAGYDLCALRLRLLDRTGNVVMQPCLCEYDSETANVTVILQDGETLDSGSVLDFDFYKDGYFVNTMTPEMLNIIGLCFQAVWQNRFNTDWLSNVSKIEDKSFQEQNRANKMNADGMRLREDLTALAGKLRKFEQDVHYRNIFSSGSKIVIPG